MHHLSQRRYNMDTVVLLLVIGGITWCSGFDISTKYLCETVHASREIKNLCLQLQSAKLLDDRDQLIDYWLATSREHDDRPTSLEESRYGGSSNGVSGYPDKRDKMDGNYIRFGRNNAIDLLNSYISSFGDVKRRSPKGGKFMRFGRSVRDTARHGNSSDAVKSDNKDGPAIKLGDTKGLHKSGQGITSSETDTGYIEQQGDASNGEQWGKHKRAFMRFGKREKDKRFMRFGRDSKELQKLAAKENWPDKDNSVAFNSKHANDLAEGKRFMRFGKSSSKIVDDSDKRFMRFGKRPAEFEDEVEQSKRFMKFGKRNSDVNELVLFTKDDTHQHGDKDDRKSSDRFAFREKQKRFMRFGKRNSVEKLGKKSDGEGYDEYYINDDNKRFMRFGKRQGKEDEKRFMRFGKRSDSSTNDGEGDGGVVNKRFMRFGKRDRTSDEEGVEKRFMRFGKRQDASDRNANDLDKRFMKFGKRNYDDDSDRLAETHAEKRFMRFGKRSDAQTSDAQSGSDAHKRFMRFGKRPGAQTSDAQSESDAQKRFMRFGKRSDAYASDAQKRFMRFGKRSTVSDVEHKYVM